MSDLQEHPIKQPIRGIDLPPDGDRLRNYVVGRNGVTRIEACQKSGEYSNIPYVRVWKGEFCEGEFSQHSLGGLYFDLEPLPVPEITESDIPY